MKRRSYIVIASVGAMILVTLSFVILGRKNNDEEMKNILQGRECLKSLEQLDVSEIEKKVNNNLKPEIVVDKDNINFYNFYENTVFLGDSITEGLAEMELINEYNVISNKGDTVLKGRKNIDKIISMKPQNIVLLYGMNDVIEFDGGGPGGVEKFKEHYLGFISEIKEKLPNSNIYIQSPLPVLDSARKTNERLTNENLNEFREVTKEVSEESKTHYVDIDILVENSEELYEGDGIHFKYDFYLKWLTYLKQIIGENK